MSAVQLNSVANQIVAVPAHPPAAAPTVDSILRLKNSILESAQVSSPELPKKIEHLRKLSDSITKLRSDCQVLSTATTAKVQNLPFYDIVKIVDSLGFLNCLCGDIGKERETVSRTLEELDLCITRVTRRELSALAANNNLSVSAGIDTVTVYTLIGSLDPNSSSHLEGLADHLNKSRAFNAASRTYALFCEKNPDHQRVKPKAILALMGAKNFSEALAEIKEAKVSLFPPEPKNLAVRAGLDMFKATCLIELKQYDEAREVLLELLAANPQNDKVKEKLASLAIEEEIHAFANAPKNDARNDASLFAKAKAMYASQDSKYPLAWTKDCLISDFKFWVFAACTSRISSDRKLYEAVLTRIDAFLKSGAVTPKTLLDTFKAKVTAIHSEAASFLDAYLKFAQETFKNIPDAALPIVEAQKTAIKETVFGDDRINGSSGLQQNLETFRIVYKQIVDSKLFEDSESKTTLREIEALLAQTNNSIQTCKDSLVKTIQDGTHPYINPQSLPFAAQLQLGQ